jgi:peptide/nickel transport system substrate-binding protein
VKHGLGLTTEETLSVTTKRCIAIAAVLLIPLLACTPKKVEGDVGANAGKPVAGGKAVVLLDSAFAGSWSGGLDPATSPSAGTNTSMMNAIYGGLFQLVAADSGERAHIEGVLAEGYKVSSDGRDVTIILRDGLKFSDGTPLDANAVKFNFERGLKSKSVSAPSAWPWADVPFSTSGNREVILHFTKPYAPAINGMPATNLNWIASPAALRAIGEEAFKITPVGAGPFKVVSNKLSVELVLEKNPTWWESNKPYLDGITFRSIGGDQSAYQALVAGNADAYEGMTSPLLLKEAERNSSLIVTKQPPTSVMVIQLNTKSPPFSNKQAREAIYLATDVQAISNGLFGSGNPTSQSFTAEGGLFFHNTVPGYRTFDRSKAKALVSQLGGLQVTIGALRSPLTEQYLTALQTQWKAAGIDAHIEVYDIGTMAKKFLGGSWQAMLQTMGSYDPGVGVGLRFRFGSASAFSGVSDPTLEGKLNAALESIDPAKREEMYRDISRYLSDNAYGPFGVTFAPAQVSRGLHAPGLTTRIPALLTNTAVIWQDAWLEHK